MPAFALLRTVYDLFPSGATDSSSPFTVLHPAVCVIPETRVGLPESGLLSLLCRGAVEDSMVDLEQVLSQNLLMDVRSVTVVLGRSIAWAISFTLQSGMGSSSGVKKSIALTD